MATLFEKFINYLKGQRQVRQGLSMEDVKTSNESPSREEFQNLQNKLEHLSNENAELKTKLAKKEQEKGQQKERAEDKEQEEQVKESLNEQEQEIQKQNQPNYFSLRKFFNQLNRNKKLRDNLYFTDFQRGKKLERFGDLGIAKNGDLVLVNDKGEIIMNVPETTIALQSPPALSNDIETYKIPLNLDDQGNYKENIDNWQAPELVPTIDGKYRWSSSRKAPYYEQLTELMTKVKKLSQEVENLEHGNRQLQDELDRANQELRLREVDSQTSRSELGRAENEIKNVRTAYRDISRELAQSRDTNIILEDDIKRVENELSKMRNKAERKDSMTSDEYQLDNIMDIKTKLVKDQPRHVVEKQKEQPSEPAQEPSKGGN